MNQNVDERDEYEQSEIEADSLFADRLNTSSNSNNTTILNNNNTAETKLNATSSSSTSSPSRTKKSLLIDSSSNTKNGYLAVPTNGIISILFIKILFYAFIH